MLKRFPFVIVLLIQSLSLTANATDLFGLSSVDEFAILLEEENEEENRELEKSSELKHKKSFFDREADLCFHRHEIYSTESFYFFHPIRSTHISETKFRLYLIYRQLKTDL